MTRTGPEHVTERQRRCWEALNRYRSVRAAADALGMSGFSLRDACEAYMRHMGMDGPLPFTKVYRSRATGQELADAHRRIEQLTIERDEALAALDAEREDRERELLRLTQRIADLAEQAHPWVEVHAKLDRLLARPAVVAAPTHRRIKDGGVGGKRERRMAITA